MMARARLEPVPPPGAAAFMMAGSRISAGAETASRTTLGHFAKSTETENMLCLGVMGGGRLSSQAARWRRSSGLGHRPPSRLFPRDSLDVNCNLAPRLDCESG